MPDTLIPDPAPPSGDNPPAPAFAWAKEDGTFNEGWIEKLPDDLRGNASLRVLGSVPDLAKSYVETKKLIGTKLEMPGENASPEQIATWRKTVGAPEKPEGYLGGAKSLRPDAIPEAMWNAEGEKKFLALAHKHHLPPAAVRDILNLYGEDFGAALQGAQAKEGEVLAAEGAKLKQAWGTDYDTNLKLAGRVAATVGLSVDDPIFANSGAVIAFAKMGKLLSESSLVQGQTPGIGGTIRERIHDIQSPASTSVLARDYRGENGPERQGAAQKQLHELMAAAGAN